LLQIRIYKGMACLLFLTSLTIFCAIPARAATPLASGDTGMLDPAAWDFTVFATRGSRDSGVDGEVPAVEVETGLTENTSVSVAAARQVVNARGESSSSGWGNAAIAYKWRFYNEDGKALVLNPSYSTALSKTSTRRGLIEDINVLTLPLIASYETGAWTLTGELAYSITSTSIDAFGYGFWTGYQANDDWLLLAEIYGEELSSDDDDESVTNFRLGFEYGVAESAAILFSVGSRISSDLPSEDKLDSELFLGFRWETG
jgi:hypothetical protein